MRHRSLDWRNCLAGSRQRPHLTAPALTAPPQPLADTTPHRPYDLRMPRQSQRQLILRDIEQRILERTRAVKKSRQRLLTLGFGLCSKTEDLIALFVHAHSLPSVGIFPQTMEAKALIALMPGQHPLRRFMPLLGLREDECVALDHGLKLYRDPVLVKLESLRRLVASSRYLGPRQRVCRPPDQLPWLLYDLDDGRFKQEARTTRTHFWQLGQLIQDHPIFHSQSRNRQRPVEHQLLVALKRFGTFGNAASVGCLARHFGISGSIGQHRRAVI